jgi:rhodanese-related sulfurtransferase
MFTAIVTAMVGLYFLSRVGLVDLSLVYLVPTFLVPQIVGGLLLGFGFVIGGYCPGTSCVSAATGRVDGIVYVLGMFAGLLGFGEVYPHIAGWAHSTPMGQITLAKLFDISYGLLVFAVVLMALGAFVAAEWAERRFGGKLPEIGSLLEPTHRLTPVRGFAVVLAGLGFIALFAGSPYREAKATVDTKQLALEAGTAADQVSAEQLADWLIAGRNDFRIVDVRDAAAFASYHLPDAINVPLTAFTADLAGRTERVIICSDGDLRAAQAWFLLRSLGYRAVYVLSGGLTAWKDAILFPQAPTAGAPARDQIDFARREAVAKYFGGAPRANSGSSSSTPQAAPETPKLTPPPPLPPADGAAPTTARKKREGC